MDTAPRPDLFPPIDPEETGVLATPDGHFLYWEVSGNPQGVPVLFLHGGPGAGTAPVYRRFFDPAYWRIILIDQRGAGRSSPKAGIEANTTAHLIGDLEDLRRVLGIDRWLLFGGSWGSTLALAYGQTHPERVLGFVLRGVFLFRRCEVDWFLTGMGTFFPEAHRAFLEFLPGEERHDPLAAYYRRLCDPDPRAHLPAADAWAGYEEACARLVPPPGRPGGGSLSLARLEAHYMVHDGFMEEGQLLRDLPRIAHLPAIIVQGRYDVICPPRTAWELAHAWPKAQLVMVPDAGHASMEPGIRSALVEATERFKGRL